MKPIRFVSGVVENPSSRIAVGVSTISNIDCNSRRRICSKKSTRHFDMPSQVLASVSERWKLFRLVRGYGRVGIHQCPLVTWEMLHASLKGPVSECTHWILIVMINFRGLTLPSKDHLGLQFIALLGSIRHVFVSFSFYCHKLYILTSRITILLFMVL